MSRGTIGASRVLWASLLAAALCLVLATRVYVSFDALRVKLVRTPVPASEGTVRIEAARDARASRLDAPVALIAVIDNPSDAANTFRITADAHPVCTATLLARSTHRVDCVIVGDWIRGPSHTLAITGGGPTWHLNFLEIATHHGSSSRLLSFHVLPDVATSYRQPGVNVVVGTWVVLWLLFLIRPVSTWPRAATRTHQVVSVIVVLLLAAAVVSPLVSPFLVILPTGSFVQVGALLLAPRLWRIGVTVAEPARRAAWGAWLRRPGVAVVAVAFVVVSLYAAFVRYNAGEFAGNYSGLIRISEAGFDRSPLFADHPEVRQSLALLPNGGYDGQFMYFAAFDPFLRRFRGTPERYRDVVDAPPYRFGRIGLPLMVRAVAGSRWQWYPGVMIGLVLLGIAVSAAALARLAQLSGMSAWWGVVVLAIPGFWQSARMVLPEPLAAAGLLIGYLCVGQRRFAMAAVVLAGSLLIRETGLIFVIALAALLPRAVAGMRGRLCLLAAIVPLGAWRLYVAAGLWADWAWEGLFYPSANISVPFVGIARLWSAVAAGDYYPGVPELSTAAVWFPLVLGSAVAAGFSLRRHLERHVAVALVAYAVLAVSLTFPKVWGHVGNAQRTSYELFVLLALATVTAKSTTVGQRRMLVGAWLVCTAFVLFGAHDAFDVRAALFPW
jgi:hypothetical protein